MMKSLTPLRRGPFSSATHHHFTSFSESHTESTPLRSRASKSSFYALACKYRECPSEGDNFSVSSPDAGAMFRGSTGLLRLFPLECENIITNEVLVQDISNNRFSNTGSINLHENDETTSSEEHSRGQRSQEHRTLRATTESRQDTSQERMEFVRGDKKKFSSSPQNLEILFNRFGAKERIPKNVPEKPFEKTGDQDTRSKSIPTIKHDIKEPLVLSKAPKERKTPEPVRGFFEKDYSREKKYEKLFRVRGSNAGSATYAIEEFDKTLSMLKTPKPKETKIKYEKMKSTAQKEKGDFKGEANKVKTKRQKIEQNVETSERWTASKDISTKKGFFSKMNSAADYEIVKNLSLKTITGIIKDYAQKEIQSKARVKK